VVCSANLRGKIMQTVGKGLKRELLSSGDEINEKRSAKAGGSWW
jgi:hypothetical protein